MHVIDSLAIGGAERMLVDIANATDPEMYTVSVCVTRNASDLASELKSHIPFTALHRKYSFDPRGFIRLRKYSRSQNVDLYHAHGRSTYSFLCAAQKLGFIDSPVILHDHFGNIEIDERVPFWFQKIGVSNLAYYIGVCDLLAKWARNSGVLAERIAVVENALDLQRFELTPSLNIRSRLNIPRDQKIGMMVGNLRFAKGLDLLIESCNQIPQNKLPVFVIIGKDADPEYTNMCRKRIQNINLEQFFHFVGLQENSVAWMKGADFGVIPSRSESGPLVLIEFMACGLPFVAFNVGGISQQVSQLLPDQFTHPENVEQFASKLLRLQNMPEKELNANAAAAKELAYQLFDIKSRMPALYRIYNSVLQNIK